MKKNKIILILIALLGTAAFLMSFNSPEEDIIETWILEGSNPEYKLVFNNNGTCEEYENGVLLTTYNYSIEYDSCSPSYLASDTIYLRWVEGNDELNAVCFEISSIGEDHLSLMIIDRGKILYFNKL